MKWKTAKVNSLCDLKNGKAYNADDWATEGLPIIRIQNLNDSSKGFNYWSGTLDKQIHVKPKDLLLAWSGTPGTSFGAHIWNGPEGVLNQHIFRIDILNGNIEKRWFQFCLNQQLNSLIHQAHGGVGLKHVTKGAVDSLEIPLPPLAEQKRIAAILDAADALRAKRREALAQLDALLQSSFLTLFGDPVTNPMGWPSALIGNLGNVVTGKTPPSKENGMFGDEIPFATPSDLDHQLEYTARSITRAGAKFSKVVRKGSTLVCCIGTLGKMARTPNPTAFNQQINAVEWGREINDWFGLFALGFCKKQMIGNSSATTLPILNKSGFSKVEMLKPPLPLQQKFAAIVESIERQKTTQRAHLAELDALFAALQHRAFRGEL